MSAWRPGDLLSHAAPAFELDRAIRGHGRAINRAPRDRLYQPATSAPPSWVIRGPKWISAGRLSSSFAGEVGVQHYSVTVGDELEARLMLRQMRDLPVGTIGFEAVGEVEDDDWEDTVEPLLRQEIAAGRKLRLLYLLGPGTTRGRGRCAAGRHGVPRAPRGVV